MLSVVLAVIGGTSRWGGMSYPEVRRTLTPAPATKPSTEVLTPTRMAELRDERDRLPALALQISQPVRCRWARGRRSAAAGGCGAGSGRSERRWPGAARAAG